MVGLNEFIAPSLAAEEETRLVLHSLQLTEEQRHRDKFREDSDLRITRLTFFLREQTTWLTGGRIPATFLGANVFLAVERALREVASMRETIEQPEWGDDPFVSPQVWRAFVEAHQEILDAVEFQRPGIRAFLDEYDRQMSEDAEVIRQQAEDWSVVDGDGVE